MLPSLSGQGRWFFFAAVCLHPCHQVCDKQVWTPCLKLNSTGQRSIRGAAVQCCCSQICGPLRSPACVSIKICSFIQRTSPTAQSSQKHGHFRTPSLEISNLESWTRTTTLSFCPQQRRKLFETTLSVFRRHCHQSSASSPKRSRKRVGTGWAALHQLCQEGWLTVSEKLEKSCLTPVRQMKSFPKWAIWIWSTNQPGVWEKKQNKPLAVITWTSLNRKPPAAISSMCGSISIQLFSSVHLSDWWWLFYQFIWPCLGLGHTPPASPASVSEVVINPGRVSIRTKWKAILTRCTSLCRCPIRVCVIELSQQGSWRLQPPPDSSVLIDGPVSFQWFLCKTRVCVKSRNGPMWSRRAARVWNSPTHATLERFSIQSGSLSYAFVHKKWDYSVNPARCHSQVCI